MPHMSIIYVSTEGIKLNSSIRDFNHNMRTIFGSWLKTISAYQLSRHNAFTLANITKPTRYATCTKSPNSMDHSLGVGNPIVV